MTPYVIRAMLLALVVTSVLAHKGERCQSHPGCERLAPSDSSGSSQGPRSRPTKPNVYDRT